MTTGLSWRWCVGTGAQLGLMHEIAGRHRGNHVEGWVAIRMGGGQFWNSAREGWATALAKRFEGFPIYEVPSRILEQAPGDEHGRWLNRVSFLEPVVFGGRGLRLWAMSLLSTGQEN
jgi:hypothetical protein